MTKPTTLQPFWHRLPESMAFPMQAGALSTLVFLTLGRLVNYLPIPFFGFMINALLTMALFKYAAECLSRAADGEVDAPAYSMHVTESHAWSHLLLQITLMILVVAALVFGGLWVGVAVMALFAYILPAATILLTMTRSIVQALNPVAWLEITSLIGAPYILLALLCFAYFTAGMAASMYFESLTTLPVLRIVGGLLSWFAMQYMVIACFHLMGYVVFQYADRLGHEAKPVALPVNMPNLRADPDQSLIDQTQAMADSGKSTEARAALLAHMKERGATTLAHEHYRRLVKKDNDQAALIEHGKRFVPVLAAQHNDKRAVEVYAETLALDNTFRPEIADDIHRMASRASLMGQHKIALHLLDGFHQRYPKHPDLVKNLLLAARLCHDKLGNAQQAQRILELIESKWPDHALTPERLALAETVAATLRVGI